MPLLMKTFSYFAHFEGHQECGISSTDLYQPPVISQIDKHTYYCPTRATLLTAMSGGGRHGFDAPFHPAGCHYRWYATVELCMILERFDAIVFIGDDMMKHIYAAFNILLRENIGLGGLKQWDMSESERETCKCDNQFTKPECAKYIVVDSEDVRKNDLGSGHPSPYYCNRAKSLQGSCCGLRLTILIRRTSLSPVNYLVACARRSPHLFCHHLGQRSRLIQAYCGSSLTRPRQLSFMAGGNSIYGRMDGFSRYFAAQRPVPLARTERSWPS